MTVCPENSNDGEIAAFVSEESHCRTYWELSARWVSCAIVSAA